MNSDKDRGMVRRAFGDGSERSKRPRWGGITDEKKGQYIQALDYALKLAIEKQDQRAINGCVKTLSMLEGQNQADEHLEMKYDRLDEGKATENIVERTIKVEFDRKG